MIIYIDENIPYLHDALQPCGKVVKFHGRSLRNKDLLESGCEALFVRSTTKVNESLLRGTEVKFVGTATSGIDHIDLEYLSGNNIEFVYAPGSNANSVAEYVVYSFLLWADIRGISARDCSIGIIGYGNIGKIVAKYANNFGMNVLINDPPLFDEGFSFPEFVEYTSLDNLCKNSDIITNHVPLTKSGKYPTFNLIRESQIALMKEKSLFIHASRGGVVDEKPLIERLKDNSIYAAIDVWEGEPLINPELAKLTILSTPHIAGYSKDGKVRGAFAMAEGFGRFFGLKCELTEIEKELSVYNPLPFSQYQNENEIKEMLRNSRKLNEDHQALLASLNLNKQERAAEFDRLRKHYPAKREIL